MGYSLVIELYNNESIHKHTYCLMCMLQNDNKSFLHIMSDVFIENQ